MTRDNGIFDGRNFAMRAALTCACLLAFCFSCGAAAASKWLWSGPHPRSGFEGTTLLKAALCPNMPPPSVSCPFYSAHADFSIYSDLGEFVGVFGSDGSGFFHINLKPGIYVIAPGVSAPHPRAEPIFRAFEITVSQRGFTQRTIHYEYKPTYAFWGTELDGAHADPPDSSPLTASASIGFGNPYLGSLVPPDVAEVGVFASNTVAILVESAASAMVGDLEILPSAATILDRDGNALMAIPMTGPNDLPGCSICPQIKRYGVIFSPSLAQSQDLFAGRWYIQISAVTASGEEYPEGTIRGQIPPPVLEGSD